MTGGDAASLPLVGGALCLDFCNTVTGAGTALAVEHLLSVADLADWSVHAGLLSGAEASRLAREKAGVQGETLAAALAARAVLRDVLVKASKAAVPGPAALARLNTLVKDALVPAAIVPVEGAFGWAYRERPGSLASVLNPVLRSAADLLVGRDLRRLKACPGRGCGRLFRDDTKNANRVWCEMRACGNRAKSGGRQRRRKDGAA